MSEPVSAYETIVAVIGESAALALFQARGGGRISIPAAAPDNHWLVRVIGREAADRLCAHYRQSMPGGGWTGIELDLPRGPTGVHGAYAATLSRARRAMGDALAAGLSADEAARRSGLTRRTAYRLRKRAKGDPRQGDLF